MSPIASMGRYLCGWANLSRSKKRFSELLGVEAAQDIHGEIVAQQRALMDGAHRAEVYDREALREMDAALRDGVITASEATRIRKLITRSAELDHTLSEAATL